LTDDQDITDSLRSDFRLQEQDFGAVEPFGAQSGGEPAVAIGRIDANAGAVAEFHEVVFSPGLRLVVGEKNSSTREAEGFNVALGVDPGAVHWCEFVSEMVGLSKASIWSGIEWWDDGK
jgi:hypothetical protein